VNNTMLAGSDASQDATKKLRGVTFERLAILYARVALGAAFLSAVADRFGLWGKYGGWGTFATFTQYTAQVNSFMPAFMVPFLAWAATAAELSLGITLIIGIRLRWVAFGAATRSSSSVPQWLFPSASNLRWITRYFPRPRERFCWHSINR
jgi:hypothetical protein